MIPTVISLDESKAWLDQQARTENVSTAEIIRTALRKYRDEKKREALFFSELLTQTSGMRKAKTVWCINADYAKNGSSNSDSTARFRHYD
jgi:hypothetical protein